MIEPILKSQLERDEGRRLKAYLDNATPPNWTIGVGHLLGSSPRMSTITDDECDALLTRDIEIATQSLGRVFGFPLARLGGPRMRALVNMMFNRGEEHVRDSTTITPAIKLALATDNWHPVKTAIEASPWAVQIKGRAVRLAKQFETGEDQ